MIGASDGETSSRPEEDSGPGDVLGEITPERMSLQLRTLDSQLQELKVLYQRAGGTVRVRARSDINEIESLRREAESIVTSLRESSLFGRYAQDAESQGRIADRWRRTAVAFLAGAVILELYLVIGPPNLSGPVLAAPALPALLLFGYASVESRNHRRAEVNRRRIYLRMAAIESYIERAGADGDVRFEKLLHDFINMHFIKPNLDPTTVERPAGIGGFAGFRGRSPEHVSTERNGHYM